jgi:hypothetical protein
MKKTLWGVMFLGIVGGLVFPGVGEAAPLSAEAKTDKQLHGLPQEKWRPLGALDRVKNRDIVQVQTVQSLAAGDDAIELIYAMPDARAVTTKQKLPLEAGGNGELQELTSLFLGNAPTTGAAGEPVLPVVPCYIVLPKGKVYDGVSVTAGKKVELPGKYVVKHAQPAIPLVKGAKPKYVKPDPAIYGSDDPFPGNELGSVRVQKKRGVTVVIVNLNPVVYRPKSGAVSYYTSLKVNVQTKPKMTTLGGKLQVKYRPDKSRPLSKQVDNPEALASYGAPSTKGGAK